MPYRHAIAAVALVCTFAEPASVEAVAKAQLQRCSAAEFDARVGNSKVFVAWFHADWCPTCQKQEAALKQLVDGRLKGNPTICQFDFDSTEALQGKLKVRRQSTMVRYRKGQETSRSVGEKNPERLKRFIEGL